MSNQNSKLYMSHITEAEPNAPKYGDAQVLITKKKLAKKMKK